MKKLLSVVVVVAVLIAGVGILKNSIARAAVRKVCRAATGLNLNIAHLNLGIFQTLIDVRGLQLENPSSFQDRIMFDIPELKVNYNLSSIIGGKIHLEEVVLNLKELTIVRAADGKLNLDYLRPAPKSGPAAKPEQVDQPRPASSKPQEVQIDVLDLSVGKVVYKDYSSGTPRVQEYPVNFHQTYRNITDFRTLVPLIVIQALRDTALSSILNADLSQMLNQFDVNKLGLDKIQSQLGSSNKQLAETAEKAASGIKELFGSLGQSQQ